MPNPSEPTAPHDPVPPRGHWIGGREHPAGIPGSRRPTPDGQRTQLRASHKHGLLAEEVLRSAALPPSPEERLGRAEAFLETLLHNDRWLDELALELALSPEVLEPELDRLEGLDLAALGVVPPPLPGQSALLLGHWTLLMAGLVEHTLRLWLSGWPVLLVGDGRLPGLVHAVGSAAAPLGSSLAALPDADRASLIGAHWRDVRAFGRVGDCSQLQALERRALLPGLGVGAKERVSASALEVYGAGQLRFGTLEDPARAARRWLGACLDAYPALGGQAHGLPTWARVPERQYAAFCEAAVGLLDDGYAQPLCPPVEGEVPRRLQAAVQAGVEQGGILVCGPEGPADVPWKPVLFVNCELGSAVVEAREPLPLLCISRLH